MHTRAESPREEHTLRSQGEPILIRAGRRHRRERDVHYFLWVSEVERPAAKRVPEACTYKWGVLGGHFLHRARGDWLTVSRAGWLGVSRRVGPLQKVS